MVRTNEGAEAWGGQGLYGAFVVIKEKGREASVETRPTRNRVLARRREKKENSLTAMIRVIIILLDEKTRRMSRWGFRNGCWWN